MVNTLVNSEGVAHIFYNVSGPDDVVNQYSVQNFELLNPEFDDYITKISDCIPEMTPIVLELTGAEVQPKDQLRIDNAIWNHYLLKLSENKIKICHALRRTFWYILSTLVSAFLVLLANRNYYSDAVTLFLYLPIWYFAYRVLTYPILDCIPIWKENRKLKQMAVLKLKFSPSVSSELTHEECEEAKKTFHQFYSHAEQDTRRGKMIQEYLMDGNKVDLQIYVSDIKDIIHTGSTSGFELISTNLHYYLSQVRKFIGDNTPVELKVTGHSFTKTEQAAIRRALDNHSELMEKDYQSKIRKTRKKIIIFTFFLIIAGILLNTFGKSVNVAVHEMIVIFLWFFGDYLIEFVLIDSVEQHQSLRAIKSIRNMKIFFEN